MAHFAQRFFTIRWILLAFIVLASIYSVVTPIFEASDELALPVSAVVVERQSVASAGCEERRALEAGSEPAAALLLLDGLGYFLDRHE